MARLGERVQERGKAQDGSTPTSHLQRLLWLCRAYLAITLIEHGTSLTHLGSLTRFLFSRKSMETLIQPIRFITAFRL